jgi:sterol desaturase/sphingolipid hydroxylase (fatty acid hydroxylase superfamily)
MIEWWSACVTTAGRIALGGLLLLGLEWAFPASRYSWTSRFRAAGFWLIYIAVTVAGFLLFQRLWAHLGVTPLLSVPLGAWLQAEAWPVRITGWVIGLTVATIIGEFFYYWFHRAQHAWLWLWRFHAVHHSLREMSALNCYHHVSEDFLRIPFVVIPMSLLITIEPGPVPVVITFVLGLQPLYEHSCTRLHWGPFRYVIADNRFHRLHHSLEPQHFDRNFGSFTSLWDQVFGTACFPRRGEWPATGLAGMEETRTVRDFLFRPLWFRP